MKTEEIELFHQPSLQIGLLTLTASHPCSPPSSLHRQALATLRLFPGAQGCWVRGQDISTQSGTHLADAAPTLGVRNKISISGRGNS